MTQPPPLPGYPPPPGYPPEQPPGYPPQQPAAYPVQLLPAYPQTFDAPVRPIVPGTNGFAVTSLVLGTFGFFPLANIGAIGCGIYALLELRTRTQKGKGLAIGGICAALVWGVVIVAVVVVMSNNERGNRDSNGGAATGTVTLENLRAGDRVNGIKDEGVEVRSFTGVLCSRSHEGEVFAVFDFPAGKYPGRASVDEKTADTCVERLKAYAPAGVDDDFEMFYFAPEQDSWNWDRSAICLAVNMSRTTGSIRG